MKNSFTRFIKAHTSGWQSLLRISFILFIFFVYMGAQAQCPVAAAIPSVSKICSGAAASIALTSNLPGTTYSWTTVQSDVVGAVEGEGTAISNTLTATDVVTGTAVYTITPLANGCKGIPVSVTITIDPIPVVSIGSLTTTITSGNPISIALNSDVAETAFSWTVIRSAVNGASNGRGSFIRQVLSTDSEKGMATYRITPISKGCAGEPINAKVLVKRDSGN
ncbi:MAG: PKD-like domain-containing protein [Bacteroidota bacterium]